MVKFASNIYEIIDILYYPSKVHGMAPYTKKLNENKQRIYVKGRIGICQLIYYGIIGIFVLTTATLRILFHARTHALSLQEGIQGFIYVLVQFATLGRVGELSLKQEELMLCLKMIADSDKILKEIGISVSYKFVHILLIVMMLLYPVYVLFSIAPIWKLIDQITNEGIFSPDNLKCILELMNLGFAYGVRNFTTYLYSAFVIIAYHRLQHLNKHLIEIETYSANNYESARHAVNLTANLHNTLYILIENLNELFAWSVFGIVSISFLEIVAQIVTGKTFQAFKLTSALSIAMALALLIPCQKLVNEAKKTRRLLCELTLPSHNYELVLVRKFALIQLLHENVELSAGGFFTLDMTAITSHLGTICTLIMFFMQIRDSLMANSAG